MKHLIETQDAVRKLAQWHENQRDQYMAVRGILQGRAQFHNDAARDLYSAALLLGEYTEKAGQW